MTTKLSKPPLTEVVFEMRWKMVGNEPFSSDPGYAMLWDAFAAYAKKEGFDRQQNIQNPYAGIGRSIATRFYQGDEKFPLLQIGPGIYAANESIQYEWDKFKPMAAKAASIIIGNYPELKDFTIEIMHLEIRYLNTFEESLIGAADLREFLNKSSNAMLSLPQSWDKAPLGGPLRGRLVVQAEVAKLAPAIHTLEIATGQKHDVAIIRLQNKVSASGQNLISTKNLKAFSSKLENWLDRAREVTSASFKSIIHESVFEKLR